MGILVEHVTKIYEGRTVLDDVSVEINDGDFATFLAPSGQGKTTLLRIIAGIEAPDRGKIYQNGEDVTGWRVQQRNIAVVFQNFINYSNMTVYENIASPLRVGKVKMSEQEIDKKVRHYAQLNRISEVLNSNPKEISGGQQQRTAIARALVKEAEYIFLDEPMTNLDYKLREELRSEMKSMFARKKGAVIFATPEPVDALALSTHVGFLSNGRLLQYGPVQEVYMSPNSIEVGRYFSYPTMNILDGRLVDRNGRLWMQITEAFKLDVTAFRESLTERQYELGIRAHFISTHREEENVIPIKAKVELREVVGSDTEVHLSHEGVRLIVLEQKVVHYDLGDEIEVYINPSHFFIFDKNTGKLVCKTHEG